MKAAVQQFFFSSLPTSLITAGLLGPGLSSLSVGRFTAEGYFLPAQDLYV